MALLQAGPLRHVGQALPPASPVPKPGLQPRPSRRPEPAEAGCSSRALARAELRAWHQQRRAARHVCKAAGAGSERVVDLLAVAPLAERSPYGDEELQVSWGEVRWPLPAVCLCMCTAGQTR